MTPKNTQNSRFSKGIAIYIAVTITAALLLVSVAVINLVIKQITVSGVARDSQAAFFAADSGIECALYWDLKNPDPSNPGKSAFSTSSVAQNILCNNQSKAIAVTAGATTTFSYSFSPDPYCVTVGVYKSYTAGVPKTQIEAKGYNSGSVSGTSCISTSLRRVERGIIVNY